MSVAPYPEYKDSGVEWIGTIPKSWSAKRLSFLFGMIGSGTTPPTDEGSYYDGELPWVTTGELRELGISDTTKRLTHDALTAFPTLRMYPPGTLLIAMYGATIGRLGWLSISACTNQACCALAVPQGVSPRFAFFALLAANEALILLASGGGQPNINQEKIRAFRLPVPSLAEQGAIAAFLDQETGKIDALVAEQERLMALLKEKRQAVISQAVTKGLNPNAPMKDSGIEWLGQVPAHWETRKLSSITNKITNGYVGPTRDILVDDGVPYLQSLHIKNNIIRFGGDYFVTPEWSAGHAKSILQEGDVLIVQTGDVGQCAVVTADFIGANCHALIVVSPRKHLLSGEWLAWVFNSVYGRDTLLSIQTGALHPHLNCGNVKDVFVPMPPLDEQKEIITSIKLQAAALDEMSTEATQAITLLRERRAALISAAVTGKIDVRALATSQPEAA